MKIEDLRDTNTLYIVGSALTEVHESRSRAIAQENSKVRPGYFRVEVRL